MGILSSRAAKLRTTETRQRKVFWIEIGMLAREDQHRGEATLLEGLRERGQFDRFRPGADHQPYVGEVQPSP